ncbi:flagellar hook-basal body complex protein FliE [Marinilactibacillus kalidii]|uniref:flagellar hook-basal body complex protein FliE n=1 Tax=Marinilactibacillus kalidii TaxID=2820274 RepID=UPI001ABEA775|nr:flagellar hook-basal body complex protein FliE [Marinilactibacillus kalidii]
MAEINALNQLYSNALTQLNGASQKAELPKEDTDAFNNVLSNALQSLEQKQAESTQAVESLVDGTADDLHTVMMKTTEAQISLDVAVQFRNRALEAYNEIKNMQF